MRLLTATLVSIFLYVPLVARPISFEQRTPVLYRAQLGNQGVAVQPDSVTVGGVTLRFAGASSSARLEGIGPSSPANYLSGGTSRTFRQYSRVALRHLYPRVDAVFYGSGGHLEYDLVATPGADLRRMRLLFEGARDVQVDSAGNLKVKADSGELLQMLPRVFQSDGKRVATNYVLLDNKQVGFRVGSYDRHQALTIDPELVFTKYFGGSATDFANVIGTDAQGNVYIAGNSNSVDFPITNGVHFHVRAPLASISGAGATINSLPVSNETGVLMVGGTPDGSVLYAVSPDAVFVSSDHGASWTQTGPFPINATAGGFPISPINGIGVDAIDPSRVFMATTRGLYFSGDGGHTFGPHGFGFATSANGFFNVSSVSVSPLDHLIVYMATVQPVGLFKSTDGGNQFTALNPTYPGQAQLSPFQSGAFALGPNGSDLYVIDPYGVLIKSTDGGSTWQQLGSPGAPAMGGSAIQIDPANPSNIYVLTYSGIRSSSDGGATFGTLLAAASVAPGVQQMALDSSSSSLYFGGPATPLYAVSTAGGAVTTLPVSFYDLHSLSVVGGQVYASFEAPSIPYVIKFDPTGTNILFSTFFGGTQQDSISALAVDAQGNCTLVGTATSPDFPATNKLSGPAGISVPAGFIVKLAANGTAIYSSLLGGSKSSSGGLIPSRGTTLQSVALDASGAAYVTGQTASSDFPLSANAYQSARPQSTCSRPQTNFLVSADSGTNAFVSKISADGSQLVYSTLLTGSCGSGGSGLAVNTAGEVVITGSTTSADFPVLAGSYQAAFPGDPTLTAPPNTFQVGFASRLSAGGDRLLASTYIGGSYATQSNAVTLDSSGNVYLTGSSAKILPGGTPGAYQTTAVDRCSFPFSIGPSLPYAGTNDAFALKLDATLMTAGYLTYLGGSCDDAGYGIALDASRNAWITGSTSSPDFPLKDAFQGAGAGLRFITEISADGSQLLFSSGTEGMAVAIDPSGGVHLAGSGATSAVTKRIQASGMGTAAEWIKVDPSATTKMVIDNVRPVTGYPQMPVQRSGFGIGVVPGELMRITGHNLGPATTAKGVADSTGRMPFTLGGTTVLFDNIPAPLVSVADGEVVCFAPFEISQTTTVTVEAAGQQSNAFRMGVVAVDVQILTIVNADGTINSAEHPAKFGDVVVLYVSGLGETKPLSADGLTNTSPLPVPIASVPAFVANARVTPEYFGAAPGQIAGISQINLRLPPNNSSTPTGSVGVSLIGANVVVYVTQ